MFVLSTGSISCHQVSHKNCDGNKKKRVAVFRLENNSREKRERSKSWKVESGTEAKFITIQIKTN